MTTFQRAVAAMRDKGEFFTPGSPLYIARAPGRLDLMGGNDDYTGGLVFEATIREATWAAVQPRGDGRIIFLNPQMRECNWQERVEFHLDQLTGEQQVRELVNRDPQVRWTAYVLGVFYLLRQRFADRERHGVNLFLQSDVPLNKGVSSSAAVEVATMKAAARSYGIDLRGIELAESCQWVENVIAQSACGIMDQITVVLGDEGHILPLVCQPCLPRPLVRLSPKLKCWAIDSGVSHAVTGIEYEAARAAAFMGYKLICDWEGLSVRSDTSSQIARWTDPCYNGYLANLPLSIFRSKFEARLPERLTGKGYLERAQVHVDPFTTVRPEISYRVRDCTRYAVEENQRVQLFAELARGAQGDETWSAAALMGDLMYQSHWAYTETGLGNEATDLLVELAREEGPSRGIFGAKVTGGGAGGTVAVLGRHDADEAFDRIVSRYGEARSMAPYIFRGSSPGADHFGVVILEA